MTMTPDPEQPQGFFGRVGQGLGGLFEGFRQAPETSETDPFANLSRNQRMMLGFAALRDAAASLQGERGGYFTEALGGFEAARERERLRRQGELANRAQALQGLAQIQQQIAIARASGVSPTPAQLELQEYFTQMLTSPGGGLEGAAPTVAPAVADAAAVPTPTPAGGMPETGGQPLTFGDLPTDVPPMGPEVTVEPEVSAPEAAPEPPAPEERGVGDLISRQQELLRGLRELGGYGATGAETAGLRAELDLVNEQIEGARAAGVAAAAQALANEDAAIGARSAINLIEEIEQSEALPGVLGPRAGRLTARTAPEGAGVFEQIAGTLFLNEDEAAVIGRVDQLLGEAFLQAFDSLRGGGQITQIEGTQATRAIQRLGNRLVSESEYREALEDLRQIYENALARAEGRPLPHQTIGVLGPEEGDTGTGLSEDALQFLNP